MVSLKSWAPARSASVFFAKCCRLHLLVQALDLLLEHLLHFALRFEHRRDLYAELLGGLGARLAFEGRQAERLPGVRLDPLPDPLRRLLQQLLVEFLMEMLQQVRARLDGLEDHEELTT